VSAQGYYNLRAATVSAIVKEALATAMTATTVFGTVPIEDYVRFMEPHTRHHRKQIDGGQIGCS
jgi:hypothetical protein